MSKSPSHPHCVQTYRRARGRGLLWERLQARLGLKHRIAPEGAPTAGLPIGAQKIVLTSSLLVLLAACQPRDAGTGEVEAGAKAIESAVATAAGIAELPGPAKQSTGHYGYGETASVEQIAGWDIDIRPDGQGLPDGSGSVEDGEMLYEEQCASCHGSFGEGVGRYPVLAGGMDSLREARPEKTVGSYWPYASTLWDYIYRAMPFTQPESLSGDEVYAITAYVLYLNELVEDDFVLTRDNFAEVKLPNEANFVDDPRPDVQNQRCMNDCRDPEIKILSQPEPAVEDEVADDSTEPAVTAAVADSPGSDTYQTACALCHDAGIGNAPINGDAEQWAARIEQGEQLLIQRAVEGYIGSAGVMPAKGGQIQLSDEAVAAAVRFMIRESQ